MKYFVTYHNAFVSFHLNGSVGKTRFKSTSPTTLVQVMQLAAS